MADPIDIKTLNLGYLQGADLIQYLPEYYLATVYDKGADNLARAVQIAQGIVQGALGDIVDLTTEYTLTGTARNGIILKLVIFMACYEIATGDEAIKKSLEKGYEDYLRMIDSIKDGSTTLEGITSVSSDLRRAATIVSVKKRYLF